MTGIILYLSQYGSTQQYALWLARDTELPLLELESTREEDLRPYRFIVIGSNIKVGHIQAAEWIKAHWSWLKEKKLLLFTCSGSYADEEEQAKVLASSFSDDIRSAFDYFPLPGRLDKGKLNLWDRIVVFLGSKVVPDEAARERMAYGFDFVDHQELEKLRAVVERLKEAPRPVQEKG